MIARKVAGEAGSAQTAESVREGMQIADANTRYVIGVVISYYERQRDMARARARALEDVTARLFDELDQEVRGVGDSGFIQGKLLGKVLDEYRSELVGITRKHDQEVAPDAR